MNTHQFLELPHRFRWGGAGPWADDTSRGDDCMTFAASWCFCALGVDPAADLRGTYRTRDAAADILARHGGAEMFMSRHLEQIGARRVQRPQDGDIGLVRMLAATDEGVVGEAMVGAVRFGPLWAAISLHKVVATRGEHVACWRLPL